MTAVKRTPLRPASLGDILSSAKEFTDAAMSIDIEDVLEKAPYQRRIGHVAANLSGIDLQREGDSNSKRIVWVAYENLHDLVLPSLVEVGADETLRLFDTDATRATLLDISRHASSYGVSVMAHKYRTEGDYFQMTDDGLKYTAENIPKRFETKRDGCPYTRTQNAAYFNRFTTHVVETFAEAHRQDMPVGWLNAVSRFLIKR